jgi:hypothetical protein
LDKQSLRCCWLEGLSSLIIFCDVTDSGPQYNLDEACIVMTCNFGCLRWISFWKGCGWIWLQQQQGFHSSLFEFGLDMVFTGSFWKSLTTL